MSDYTQTQPQPISKLWALPMGSGQVAHMAAKQQDWAAGRVVEPINTAHVLGKLRALITTDDMIYGTVDAEIMGDPVTAYRIIQRDTTGLTWLCYGRTDDGNIEFVGELKRC